MLGAATVASCQAGRGKTETAAAAAAGPAAAAAAAKNLEVCVHGYLC